MTEVEVILVVELDVTLEELVEDIDVLVTDDDVDETVADVVDCEVVLDIVVEDVTSMIKVRI